MMPKSSSIANNLVAVDHTIARACEQARRVRSDVNLIAVSKGQDFSKIVAAYAHGQRDFGESYAQEMVEKMARAAQENLCDIRWHFIGALQSNKLKLIKNAHVIHGVSSTKTFTLLDQIVSEPKDIFLQVNLDQNPARSGFFPEHIFEPLHETKKLKHLRCRGLMTIVPLTKTPALWFAKMAELKESVIKQGLLDEVELSMGMSDDFVDAIFYGANWVRIGTKIFGQRN